MNRKSLNSRIGFAIFAAALMAFSFAPPGASFAETGLNMTPTELMNKINAYAKRNKMPQPIRTVYKDKSGPADVRAAYLTDMAYPEIDIVMITPLDSKKMIYYTVVSLPKTKTAVSKMMFIYEAVISVMNPELSSSQVGKTISYLLQDLKNPYDGMTQTRTVKNIKYTFSYSSYTGFALFVRSAFD